MSAPFENPGGPCFDIPSPSLQKERNFRHDGIFHYPWTHAGPCYALQLDGPRTIWVDLQIDLDSGWVPVVYCWDLDFDFGLYYNGDRLLRQYAEKQS